MFLPSSSPAMLPPETLELILIHVTRTDLLSAITASAVLHNVAARVLYRSLTGIPTKRALLLVRTLTQNDLYPPFVREFDLDLSENSVTGNFLRLLHQTLKRLQRLSSLTLDFSSHDSSCDLAWILQSCPFSLRSFTTSMRCEPLMARFLETQNDIVEICLRGFNSANLNSLVTFPLAPHALPHLTHFRTVLSAPQVIAEFLRGRPIESVSMAMYPGEPVSSLDALLTASRPVKRLTIMSFDISSPVTLIGEISSRLPRLEALHTVALIRNYSHDMLVETAASLTHFKTLKYLTFMAPGALTTDTESEIATIWHKACPTLKTIILPKGVVWGYVGGRWISLQDAPASESLRIEVPLTVET